MTKLTETHLDEAWRTIPRDPAPDRGVTPTASSPVARAVAVRVRSLVTVPNIVTMMCYSGMVAMVSIILYAWFFDVKAGW